MTRYIAISGPSSTGKTSLINSLSTHVEMKGVLVTPDLYNTVWSDLVEKGFFSSYADIYRDSEYLCVYILKLLMYYEDQLAGASIYNKLVVLDCCWLDLLVYALLNMWSNRILKDLQSDILNKICLLNHTVDKIYLTRYDDSKSEKKKAHLESKIYSVKSNRSLEIQYYNTFSNFNMTELLPSSDITDNSLFIIDDLRKLGYI